MRRRGATLHCAAPRPLPLLSGGNMAEQDGPRRRSWRDMTQTVFGVGGGGNQKWRSEARPQPRRVRRKAAWSWAQKLAAALVALGLIVAAGILAWYEPKTTPVIAICVTDYPEPIPPNAWALEDGLALAAVDSSPYLRPVHEIAFRNGKRESAAELAALEQAATPEAWLKSLRAAVQRGARVAGENAVVVYLSMHGALDDERRPCLIPAVSAKATRADLLNAAHWIPLRGVMDALEEEAKGRGVNVLLALDADRLEMLPELGILANHFAAAAQEEVENGGDRHPHVAVLNSTSVGQTAWSSPEMRRSVFAFYLEHGLRGAADDEGNDDRFVSVHELHGYVQRHVDAFVRGQLGEEVRQLPRLWPKQAQDFQVARCNAGHEAPLPKGVQLARAKSLGSFLGRLDAELNASGDRAPGRTQPQAWERHRSRELRLEQLLAAGEAYSAEATALVAELNGASFSNPGTGADLAGAAVSLALTKRLTSAFLAKYTPADRQGFAEQITAIAAAPAPAPEATTAPPSGGAAGDDAKPKEVESSGSENASAEKPPEQAEAPKEEPKPGEQKKLVDQPDLAVRTLFVWEWFIAAPRGRDEVARVMNAVLASGSPSAERPLAELQWMRLLQRDFAESDWAAKAELIRDLGRLRNASEELAALIVPTSDKEWRALDVRALAPLSERLAEAEAKRRECEDLAFLDQFDAAEAKTQSLLNEYQALRDLAVTLDEAYAAFDVMQADTPKLVAWKCLEQRQDASPSWNAEKTQRLYQALTKLEGALREPEEEPTIRDTATVTESVRGALKHAQSLFQPLESDYHDEVDLVLTAAKDNPIPEHYRRLTALLAVAPVRGGERAGLLARRDELALTLYEDRSRTMAATAPPAAENGEDAALDLAALEEVASWSTGLPRQEITAGSLRQRLTARESEQTKALAQGWKSTSAAERGETLGALAEGSRRLAAFAPSAFDDAAPEPAQQFAWHELSRFIAWQGERIRGDFLGDSDPALANLDNPIDSRGAKANFFDLAGAQLLSAETSLADARAVKGNADSQAVVAALRGDAARSEAELNQARSAAAAGMPPSDGRLAAGLFGTIAGKAEFANASALPAGLAAVWIPAAQGLIATPDDPTQRAERRVGAAASPAPLEFRFDTAQATLQAVNLRPSVYFRGHYWRGTWSTAAVGAARTVVYQPPEPAPPQVLVRDPRSDRVAFSVVLDCSGSMTPVEGADMMEPAKAALLAALEPVARERKHLLSVRLFAHRFRYMPVNNQAMHQVSRYFEQQESERERNGQPLSRLLHPNDDIELIRPMGGAPFNSNDLKRLADRLAPVGAWGCTPLYLSIERALKEDQPRVPPGFRHHLIVITDGTNEVYDKSLKFANQPNVTSDAPQPTVDQLIRLFNPGGVGLHGVKLDVLALLDRNDRRDEARQRGIEEVVRLDGKTDGAFVFDPKGSSLIGNLRRAIGLQDFHLVDGNRAISKSVQLGEAVGLNADVGVPQENVVAEVEESKARSEPFPLRGSESIDLEVVRDGAREALVHRRYMERADDAIDQGTGFYAAAHRPRLTKLNGVEDELTFRVSLQNADPARYLPPPAEAWAEITLPARGGGAAPTYLAYDLKLEPKQPVGIVDWTLLGYEPRRGDQAQIRIWWSDRKAPILAELRVADLLAPDGVRPPGVAGLTLKGTLQGTTLTIEERHDGEGPSVPWARIALHDQQSVKSITRKFYPDVRGASHRFELDSSAAPSLQSGRVLVSALYREPVASEATGVQFATFPQVRVPYYGEPAQ